MTEFERASTLIAQTGADALLAQLTAGRLTPDEYHRAVALMEPMSENGVRCIYCGKQAHVGNTCAAHADKAAVAAAAHAHMPVIDYSRYPTRDTFIAAVRAALGSRLGARWAMRAGHAQSMNALHMIAMEFPIVLRSGLQ